MEKQTLNMPYENTPHGWYITATNGYLNKDGTVHRSCNTNTLSNIPAYAQPNSGYWKTYELALEAKRIYEGTLAITYGFSTRLPEHDSNGWYIFIGGVNMHLCTDCIPRTLNTSLYKNNKELFFFETEEEANRVMDLYISYGLYGPENSVPIAQPEPPLVAYKLENPVQDNDKWCVYTKDTGYYSYALSANNTICHTAYRKHWDTENAALFSKLCYERSVKHLKK